MKERLALLPVRIRVGAADYLMKRTRSTELLGRCLNRTGKIQLSERQSPNSARDTLLHEVLHAIIWCSGAKQALDLSADAEEATVRLLTPWLLAALRDNPDLVAFLLEVDAHE